MIYFTSDWHFNHNKDFVWFKRGYNSIEEMNEAIISNICSTLDEGDELWVLGDIIMGETNAEAAALLSRIPYSVHFLIGNHDSYKRIQLYKSLGWINEGYATTIQDGKWHFYLSHYPTFTSNYDDNKKHLPLINLFGHTHQEHLFFLNNPYMYHVGVDSHDCMPISIDKIKQDIKDKVQKELNI